MSKMKTLCFVLTIGAPFSVAHASSDFLSHVTTCVGRLSAQMEYHWLMQDIPTQEIETQRAHLIEVLDTLITSANASEALHNRIESKLAHSALLTRAAFSADSRTRSYANSRVAAQLRACGDILLTPPAEEKNERVTISNVHSGEKLVNRSAIHETRSQ